MATTWMTTMKPTFTTEWLGLPNKEMHQVLEKIKHLERDPRPDAKVKKQLKYLDGDLFRIRSGDFRIFYTFDEKYVSLLALRRRSEDTYDEDFDISFLGGFDPDLQVTARPLQPNYDKLYSNQKEPEVKLPEPLTIELLNNLKIPAVFQTRLLNLKTRAELYECPEVPDEVKLKLDEYLFERTLVEVTNQPDLLLQQVDDLLRFKEGELLSFLLRLSSEQEKFVTWGLRATGPTLVKGGPGTGKSTVALYRVRSLIKTLKETGLARPRILFTTYTNALVISSRQLLEQLLGDDASLVEVSTADKLIGNILRAARVPLNYNSPHETRQYLREAIELAKSRLEGNLLQRMVQAEALDRFSESYLLEEINGIIAGRQLSTLEDYLQARRQGRKVALSASQRKVIWQVHLAFREFLQAGGKTTFAYARDLAEQISRTDPGIAKYDAVVVDEAQDLGPSVLRILIRLCKTTNRLFITADANQSIYGSGFNWSDVHSDLRFQGRTGLLKANYRSTREIGEAAQSYLSAGTLDDEPIERIYINNGPPPAARAVRQSDDEAALLAGFLRKAARDFRLGLAACAVLCPTENAGKALAARLTRQGIQASFMSGKELNLVCPGVKILTLKSSKGLEFPIVALAGFFDSFYPVIPAQATSEETVEINSRERRTMFVGMTRAMRALLVIVPVQSNSDLLTGFDGKLWNLGQQPDSQNYL